MGGATTAGSAAPAGRVSGGDASEGDNVSHQPERWDTGRLSFLTSGGQPGRRRLLRLDRRVFRPAQAGTVVVAAGQPRWHVTGRQSAVVLGELVLSQGVVAAEFLESLDRKQRPSGDVQVHPAGFAKHLESEGRCVRLVMDIHVEN